MRQDEWQNVCVLCAYTLTQTMCVTACVRRSNRPHRSVRVMELCFPLRFYLHYSDLKFFVCFVRTLLRIQTSIKADLFLAGVLLLLPVSAVINTLTETRRLVWTQSFRTVWTRRWKPRRAACGLALIEALSHTSSLQGWPRV